MFFESFGIAIIIPYLNILVKGSVGIEFINQYITPLTQNELVFYSTLFLIIFFVIKNLYIFLFNYFQLKFRTNLNQNLASALVSNYLYMPYKEYFERNSSLMIRNVTSSCSDYCNLIMSSISIINDLLIILGIFILIVFLQGTTIFSVLFVFFIFCFSFYLLIKKRFKIWGEKRHFYSGQSIKYLNQPLSSPKDLKIFRKQNYFLNIFKNVNQKVLYFNFLRDLISTLPRNIFEIFGIIIISLFLIREINLYDFTDAIINLSVLLLGFVKILPSISRMIVQLSILKNGQEVTNEVYRELKINPDSNEINIVKNSKKLEFKEIIEFKNINFSFGKKVIFENLNLKIKKGEKIIIFGESGSGKSTFVNLLTGILKPTDGEILIDNQNIFNNLTNFRKKIGYVPQEFLMLDDTIKNNIAFGLENHQIDLNKLENSIEKSFLKSYIETLPNKENENIGEKGITISGGQKQRIAIARALYENPEILIMDEPTSAIDSQTENEIISEVLKKNESNITMIVVSHNLNLKKYFDRSIEFKNYGK